ncbi:MULTISPECIES: hypothetical protein [unclassified Herbaspirillum]|uniref:hypothetical protein n=1 Tax=unclassified Herbaspirillum TaxID=2624150 RepID=UPI000E2F521D|nr:MULTISPECIES: hypothetical protein [unclassified Herbaspirillum]RFB70836.1 hypothetical protein DZB54_09395 [Herbaspirillum sp. 3R-3a1]TFI08639.1 hypothetical protein E4P32_10860 [Herbaspirillum sp. 3R11]TFI15054.1 hypothetical protein E4P31_10855 [Herbaspirillum sp. 3R-11]TFI29757.1 hypothetical protein E4P30_05685 [Herbaspirillum sp. 3C11]
MTTRKLPAELKPKRRLANPFKGYQDKGMSEREEVIIRYLASLKKTRAKFEYVTDLAKAVAEQIQMVERKPCSFTTLLRNSRYKAQLLNFMAMRAGTNAVQVSEPAALALIHTVELELSNVKRDNERLRTYIADLEAQVAPSPVLTASPTLASDNAAELSRLSNDKAMACKALWLTLEHFKELIRIDLDRGCIVDLATLRGNNVIVEPEIAKAFLDWLRVNDRVGI